MTGFKRWWMLALAAGAAFASTTTTWEMNTYQDFLRGRFSNVALSRDGRLSLAPKLETVFASDQPEIWAIAKASRWFHLPRHRPPRPDLQGRP